jgi:predicted  nucleic acid-binding Zn-ribbon protein
MGLKDIVARLDSIFDTKKGRAAKQSDAISELIAALDAKLEKYNTKLSTVKTGREKDKLTRKIKVCKAQIEKGRAALGG